MILFAYGHQSLQVMHYVILWIVLSRMSIQPAHAHWGKRDGMTKSSAWGELVPRSGEDYGDKGMVYPASPAGLVLRSRLVGSDFRAWHRLWTDYGATGSYPLPQNNAARIFLFRAALYFWINFDPALLFVR